MRIVLTFLLLTYFFQSPLHAHPDDCSDLLLSHITRTSGEFLPWSKLSAEMKHRRSATILVKIPVSGVASNLGSLLAFEAPLKSPLQFVTIADQSLHVVVNGPASSLLQLQGDERFGGASFQVLGSEVVKRSFVLELPQKMVEMRDNQFATVESVRALLEKKPEARLGILDRMSGQIFFILPKGELAGVTLPLLKRLGISYEKTAPGSDVVAWLIERKPGLDAKVIVQNGRSWILSQNAFNALKTIEGTELKLATARTSKVVEALRRELDQCFQPVCIADAGDLPMLHLAMDQQIPVSQAESNLLRDTPGLLQSMIATWAKASGKSLSLPDALHEGALELNNKLISNERQSLFNTRLVEIDFGIWDGRGILKLAQDGKGKYLVAMRFIQAWKALEEAFSPENRIRPLTVESVEQLQRLLRNEKVARAASPAPESALSSRRNRSLRLSSEEISHILRFLSYESGVPMSTPGRLPDAFSVILAKHLTGEALAAAQAKIAAIGFLNWDMNNARYAGSPQARLIEGMQVLAEAGINPGIQEEKPSDPADGPAQSLPLEPSELSKFKTPVVYAASEFTKKRKHGELTEEGPKKLGPARPFALVRFFKSNGWGIIDGGALLSRSLDDVIAALEKAADATLASGVREMLSNPEDLRANAMKATSLTGDPGRKQLWYLLDKARAAAFKASKSENWYVIVPFSGLQKQAVKNAEVQAAASKPVVAPPQVSGGRPPQAWQASPTLGFTKPLFGRDKLLNLESVEKYLIENSAYSLPLKEGLFKIIYNSPTLGESVMLVFESGFLRSGEPKFTITDVQSVSDVEQSMFWRELARLQGVNESKFDFSRPLIVAGRKFLSVKISRSVMMKLRVKHGFESDRVMELLAECRNTVLDGQDYRSDFYFDNRRHRAMFALRDNEVYLKSVFLRK